MPTTGGRCNAWPTVGNTARAGTMRKKRHPCLIPYADLPEAEKAYDRQAAMETLKAIVALGYRITGTDT